LDATKQGWLDQAILMEGFHHKPEWLVQSSIHLACAALPNLSTLLLTIDAALPQRWTLKACFAQSSLHSYSEVAKPGCCGCTTELEPLHQDRTARPPEEQEQPKSAVWRRP